MLRQSWCLQDPRLLVYSLRIRYDDATKVDKITADIKAFFDDHPGVDHKLPYKAALSDLGTYSVDISIMVRLQTSISPVLPALWRDQHGSRTFQRLIPPDVSSKSWLPHSWRLLGSTIWTLSSPRMYCRMREAGDVSCRYIQQPNSHAAIHPSRVSSWQSC